MESKWTLTQGLPASVPDRQRPNALSDHSYSRPVLAGQMTARARMPSCDPKAPGADQGFAEAVNVGGDGRGVNTARWPV